MATAVSIKACNVLLVVPKFTQSFWNFQVSCQVVGASYPAAPLGLMTVAALLPEAWTPRLVDCNVKEVTDADLAWADLVMTGGMITQRGTCLAFVSRAQAAGKVVAVGGPDATGSPEAYAQADFVVVGEAEDVIKDFIAAWEAGERCGRFTRGKVQGRRHQDAGATLRSNKAKRLLVFECPILARLSVHLRVLRHHRALRPRAAGQDDGANAGRARRALSRGYRGHSIS